MYIKECGYGRSRKCRRKLWPVIGICVLILGLSGITAQVMAGQLLSPAVGTVSMLETAEEIGTGKNSIGYADVAKKAEEKAEEDITEPVIVKEEGTLLIVIDPGHGGEDEGCTRADVDEKSVNLQIGLELRDKLTQMGYTVLMTREDDSYRSLEERVNLANRSQADAYISIHQNAWDDTDVSGIETWYHASEDGNNKRLAQLIHNDVLLYTKGTDRELWEDESLYVIRETNMPSCLVETGFLSNTAERQSLKDDEYRSKIVEGIASGIDLYFYPKTMYLTFDDGPSAENTCTILDILKEKDIKATFFVVGENVRRYPEVARRIVEEGHTIGIHCNSHDYKEIYKSVDSYVADFEEAYQTVYEVTGVKVQMFRFPGGSINSYNKKVYKDIIEEMTEKGFIYYDWNASLQDAATGINPDMLIQSAKDTTLGRKKVIMLAHDVVHDTALCLEELLEQFPEYQMEPLTPDVEPIQF